MRRSVLSLTVLGCLVACGARPPAPLVTAGRVHATGDGGPARSPDAGIPAASALTASTAPRERNGMPGVEAPLPAALVRPRLVGLVRVGDAWAAALEESPVDGERIVVRALDDLSRDAHAAIPLAPPLGFAVDVVGGTFVLAGAAPDEHVYALAPEDAAPHVLATAHGAPFTRSSTRAAFAARGSELGGIVVTREADEPVHPFARPRRVALEHVTAWTLASGVRRGSDFPLAASEAVAWLAAAANDDEGDAVRVVVPRAPIESLDGMPGARVRVARFAADGTLRAHADVAAPLGVTLDAIAALAPDGTLAVALLDAHDGDHALVVLPFGPTGSGAPVALDARGPLHDGDARLVACGEGLDALTVTTHDDALELAVQQVLPATSARVVLWRGARAGDEGHVLAAVCDARTLVVALQRAPIVSSGSLVVARHPLDAP